MYRQRFIRAVTSAFRPAVRTALWVAKMMLPVTLVIACLDFMGVIGYIAGLAAPFFGLIGLPGESALVFLTSIFATLYSSVAVIATLGFDFRTVTILAVMCLICHNLVIETAIQRKAGASAWFIVALRVGVALLAGALLNLILPEAFNGRLFLPGGTGSPATWAEVGLNWIATMGPLTLKMFVIIVVLNIIQSILREFGVMKLIAVPLQPFMKVFGLPRSTSFLWIICNMVGLTYGGAALMDELERGEVSHADARLLNTHVAISHSLLEDTFVMASIGVGLFWLLIPRLVLAVAAVWLQRGYYFRRAAGNRNVAPASR